MKIFFEDKSYLEFERSAEPDKVMVTILAKDPNNQNKNIANSVEITSEQLVELFNSVK